MYYIKILLIILLCSSNVYAVQKKQKPNLGQCEEMGSRISRCIPGKCKMTLPIPANFNTVMTIELLVFGRHEGKCKFETYKKVKPQDLASMVIHTKCLLSPRGLYITHQEFEKYKNGDINQYLLSERDDTLKSECTTDSVFK